MIKEYSLYGFNFVKSREGLAHKTQPIFKSIGCTWKKNMYYTFWCMRL